MKKLLSKKLLSLVLAVIMLVSVMCTPAFADDGIKVIINGKNLTMDQPPVIVNDRTLVPLRAIFEGLGANVEWDDSTKTATGVKDGKEIKITINNTTAYVDGQAVALDVPAQLISDRTMVPVRFISENLGEKVDWDDANKTVIITSEDDNTLLNLTFDDMTSFENNKDFICGGAYKAENVSLSTDVDHTTGNGKSVKMANREVISHRLKILNATKGAKIGETYIISAYVYTEEEAISVAIGMYSDTGTEYATTPAARKKYDVKAKTWTKIEVEYKHTNEIVSQIGIDQIDKSVKPVATMYVDDVTVTLKGGQTSAPSTPSAPQASSLNIPVVEREGKRPTPLATNTGKTYDDLIFYDRVFEEESEKKDSEARFAALPANPKVMADHSDLVASKLTGAKYASVEKVAVSDMPFTEALRATVTEIPPYAYNAQMVLESLEIGTFEDGDNMLVVFYMRTIDAQNEFGEGQVQLIVEQEVAPNQKVLQENVTTLMGGEWKKVYLPFTAQQGYTRLCIRLGYYMQTVEFGGYQILNYGKDIKIEDLPTDTSAVNYDGKDIFDKNTQWRRDAWAKIEQIRKGDIKVIVKDANGNVIPDADVKIDMYDHEFKWGSAVNGNLLKEGEFGDKYRQVVSTMFNTAVSEAIHKPVEYYKDPQKAQEHIDKAKELGLKYYRGHTLVWDRKYDKTYDAATDSWVSNSTVSEELMRLQLANDKAGIDAYMEKTIKEMAGASKGQLIEWDVINEQIANNQLSSTYGVSETIKKWFDWAREAVPDAKLFYNECAIVGNPGNQYLKNMKILLDEMIAAGTDFDGIGIQGHLGTMSVSPYDFYQEVIELAKYGKDMRITEFDVKDKEVPDEEFEASYTRDVMILMFSIENMNGFLMWGFTDASHWLNNAPLFDANWNLKLSGEQYIDLVYNKWWTQEEGTTGADGAYSVKGYYGDYLITATKDGKTATADVQCYKGNNNTIEIILK